MPDYSFKYDKVMDKDAFLGKAGYLQEFFGTMFWFFLANKMDMWGMGAGLNWGVAFIITNSIFSGHFNALRSLRKMIFNGDICDSLMRMIMQMLAGLCGHWVFGFFNTTATFADSGPSLMVWGGDAWKGHAQLLVALIVYFKMYKAGNDQPFWFFYPFTLWIVFMVGGSGFAFAPNRIFNVAFADAGGAFKGMGIYVLYAVYGALANFIAGMCDKSGDMNVNLPQYDSTE